MQYNTFVYNEEQVQPTGTAKNDILYSQQDQADRQDPLARVDQEDPTNKQTYKQWAKLQNSSDSNKWFPTRNKS